MSGRAPDRPGASGTIFGGVADAYAAARPSYPDDLFDWIAETCRRRERAWDCASGSGQASAGLASRFAFVSATDLSVEQIRRAPSRADVAYCVARAEAPLFRPGAFDLVAVAQALHWLDLPRFWAQVADAARPGALFCAWGYATPETEPEIEARLIRPFRALIAPFWAAENLRLWRGYQPEDMAFPFQVVAAPAFAIRTEWTLAELFSFMSTWSAAARARIRPEIGAALDDLLAETGSLAPADARFPITLRLEVLAGRI